MPSYDASKVSVNFSGVQIGGFGPDTFVNIEYNSDLWALSMGADGEAVRSRSSDLSAKVTITLQESSAGNLIMQGALTAGMAGVSPNAFPLVIIDGATLTTHMTEGAWVMKPPTKVYGKEANAVEWVLECAKLIPVMGFSIESP